MKHKWRAYCRKLKIQTSYIKIKSLLLLLLVYSYRCIGVARYNIERLKNEAISSRD
ncbi:hypothetical protein I3843_02G133500 [Carya illinoinensis]|nr:hypothetical protein I3760_02G155600 [Carya illinoinensis]KAG7992550.1 hypothetical protein I3843_02G133500 [Carya illinoinensis]